MSKSPLQIVKEKFGEKSKLVEAVKALATDDLWLNRINSEKGLEFVSNAKLLRLFNVFTAVKEKFGTRAKLIAAIAELENHAKDEGYIARLGTHPVPRLYDAWQSADLRAKRAKAAAAKPKAPAAPKKARSKKAKLKSAEAKKAAAAPKAAPAAAAAAAPAKAETKKAAKKK